MTAGEVIAAVAARGGTIQVVTRDGIDKLHIAPSDAITSEELTVLREIKPDVIALVKFLHEGAGDSLLDYAGDVLGFEGEPTADDLIDQAHRLGGVLYVRKQGDVGIRNGEMVPDATLLRVARAHVRILTALKDREAKGPPLIDDYGPSTTPA